MTAVPGKVMKAFVYLSLKEKPCPSVFTLSSEQNSLFLSLKKNKKGIQTGTSMGNNKMLLNHFLSQLFKDSKTATTKTFDNF